MPLLFSRIKHPCHSPWLWSNRAVRGSFMAWNRCVHHQSWRLKPTVAIDAQTILSVFMPSFVVERAFSPLTLGRLEIRSDRHRKEMLLIDCLALLRLEDVITGRRANELCEWSWWGLGTKRGQPWISRNWTRLQARSRFRFMQSWSTDRYRCSCFCGCSFCWTIGICRLVCRDRPMVCPWRQDSFAAFSKATLTRSQSLWLANLFWFRCSVTRRLSASRWQVVVARFDVLILHHIDDNWDS